MQLNADFRDLLCALNGAGARYLLVGGYAVSYHAEPRFTKDLDVWVEPSTSNAPRVLAALREFGAPLAGLTEQDLVRPDLIYQIGVPPNRIDVLTGQGDIPFERAWPNRVEATYADVSVPVIGRLDLIAIKRRVVRPQDLIDADRLES